MIEFKKFIEANKRVLGKFKDEMDGKKIVESICLKPKMYSLLLEEKNIIQTQGHKKINHQTTHQA